MQIIIDIPKEVYEGIMDGTENTWDALDLILKSKILPKGHGRLIDADALAERMKQRHYENADEESYWIADVVGTALNPNYGYAPTIIEADKEIGK